MAREWAITRHTTISAFAVCRAGPKGRRVESEYDTFEDALNAARRLGRNRLGRRPIIYALTPEGWGLELGEAESD